MRRVQTILARSAWSYANSTSLLRSEESVQKVVLNIHHERRKAGALQTHERPHGIAHTPRTRGAAHGPPALRRHAQQRHNVAECMRISVLEYDAVAATLCGPARHQAVLVQQSMHVAVTVRLHHQQTLWRVR